MDPNEYQIYNQPSDVPPPLRKNKTKLLGYAAVILSVAILFSAIGAGLTYSLVADQSAATTAATVEIETTGTNGTTQTTEDRDIWSVIEAATRHDDDKVSLSVMEIASLGKPAVVAINTTGKMTDLFGQTGDFTAAGSGFVISADGYIVTNNHVIADASTITVVMNNGDIFDAILIGSDTYDDLAVLKIDAKNLTTVYIGQSADLQVGELAVAIGNPLGELSGTVTAGIISALDREIRLENQTMNLLQTDAAINPGNSGGPLFNSFGEVIGINTAKTSQTGIEGLGYAIPIDDAMPTIESLIKNGYVTGRTKIGISTRDMTRQMAEYYDMTEGVYVEAVASGSAADLAGVLAEDTIIAANGAPTLTTNSLMKVKDRLIPGDQLILTIVRNGKQMDLTLILQEDKPS